MKYVLAALAVSLAVPAWASCGPRDAAVALFWERYGEAPQTLALAANGMLFEVFANLETGSWTATLTDAHGKTCLLASGSSYSPVPSPPIGEEM